MIAIAENPSAMYVPAHQMPQDAKRPTWTEPVVMEIKNKRDASLLMQTQQFLKRVGIGSVVILYCQSLLAVRTEPFEVLREAIQRSYLVAYTSPDS